jgi:hypothetical protein
MSWCVTPVTKSGATLGFCGRVLRDRVRTCTPGTHAEGGGEAHVGAEDLVDGHGPGVADGLEGDLDRGRTPSLDGVGDALGPLAEVGVGKVAHALLGVAPELTALEGAEVGDDVLGRTVAEADVDGSSLGARDGLVLGDGVAQEGGVGGVLLDEVVDGVEGDVVAIGDLDEPATDVIKVRRGNKVGAHAGVTMERSEHALTQTSGSNALCRIALELLRSQGEVAAEVAVHATEEEVGTDVREEADGGLRAMRTRRLCLHVP